MAFLTKLGARLQNLDARIFGVSFTQYHRLLRPEIVGHCETLLDVGCGESSPVRQFTREVKYSVGVDSHQPSIDRSRAAFIHTDYRCRNILEIGKEFAPRSFDCVIALDVIEHLTKEDGLRLLDAMESIARRRVVIFTPNGFLPQPAEADNPHQLHVSGWTPDAMRARGYRVIGVGGWRPLRGPYALPRRPKFLTERLSLLTERFLETRPERALQILCVKDV